MTATLIELTQIYKSFPGVHALKDVSFAVNKGEIHALLGENGAGKSTLIKIIAGVHRPDQGALHFQGAPVQFKNPRDAQQQGVATIYQELSLYPDLSVAENIFMGHAPMRTLGPLSFVNWAQTESRAAELLSELEVHDLDVRQKVGSLSVGNRQRIEIAKALSSGAKLLIMDEPTAALTESDVAQLFRIVRLLKARGVGIVFITHKLGEVFELADRVTVLRDGQFIGTRKVSETSERELISMMVGRTIDNLYPKQPAKIGKTVLRVKDLTRLPHTNKLSFTVQAGEIVGLAGLVGSGRSESAQVIFGIRPASGGQILVEDKTVTIRTPSDALRHGIAYVPEDRATQGLIKAMNIRENTSLAVLKQLARASFIQRNREQRLANEAIARFSIRATSSEQVVNKLSGGNQQKVVLSKWLAREPRLLIMDEPTRGVDVGAKSEIHRLMSQLAAERGLAILMISSELPEILGMSDRVLVMREGRIVATFDREHATQEAIGAAMMSSAVRIEQPNQEASV